VMRQNIVLLLVTIRAGAISRYARRAGMTIRSVKTTRMCKRSETEQPRRQTSYDDARFDETRDPSTHGRSELRRRNLAEREMRLQVLYRLAVRLRVGINEVIQRFALLV